MRKSILFLTDLGNGEDEDLITVDYLKKEFDVTISYFEGIEKIEDEFDLIIIRNTWPVDHSKAKYYKKIKKSFLARAKKKGLKVYNDLNASCDFRDKTYLTRLYQNSFPVIPSVDSLDDLDLLPQTKRYLIKPKDGFSSIGVEILSKEELLEMKLGNYIIQPKIDFQYEMSFYFIDGNLLYCLIFKPFKSDKCYHPVPHKPSESEVRFAKMFVEWDKMQYGICRIDALMTNNGKLLLLEIEDSSPYFSITEIDEKLRNLFLEKFMESVKKVVDK